MQSLNNLTKKQKYILGILGISILLTLVIALIPRKNIDVLPSESSESDYSQVANIHEGLELLRALGGATRYNSFAKDLRVYGVDSYKEYQKKNTVVGFELTSKIKSEGEKLSFTGKYGSSSHKINVTLEKLPNNRLKTELLDTKTKKSIDDKLPSNSATNKFIAKLPIYESDYEVTFLENSQRILISIYDRDQKLSDKAYNHVKSEIGDTIDDKIISITFPSPSEGESRQLPSDDPVDLEGVQLDNS